MMVDPRRFRVLHRLKLKGAFAFDALSPDGSLMYLLQYLGKPGAAAQPYAVRAFNWKTKTLYPGAIVDRREPGREDDRAPDDAHGNPERMGVHALLARRQAAASCMRSTPPIGGRSASICPGRTRMAGS